MAVRWKEKVLCSNHTEACIFDVPNIHQQTQDQLLLTRTVPGTNKREFQGNFPFFFPRKSYQSLLDLHQPEMLHYGVKYIQGYITYIITNCPIEQNKDLI